MRLKDIFSIRGFKAFPLALYVVWRVKEWHHFIRNYLGSGEGGTFHFRDGAVFETRVWRDAVTLGVVYLHKSYGDIPNEAKVILDIGANIGAFSVYAARCNPNAKIFACEPHPDNAALLRRNIENNNLRNVTVYQVAIGDKDGTCALHLSDSPYHSIYTSSDKKENMEVPVWSFNTLLKRINVDFIDILKLDCEGAEYDIMLNAIPEELRRVYSIRLEYHEHLTGLPVAKLLDVLQKSNFEVIYFKKDKVGGGIIIAEQKNT